MTESKIAITENFLKHLAKGGVKIIPIFGGLLEEMIFGTLDAKSAAEEVKKLQEAISTIQEQSHLNSAEVFELTARIRQETSLRAEAEGKLEELTSAIQATGAISLAITQALERLLLQYEMRLEDIVGDLEAGVDRLADAIAVPRESAEYSGHIALLTRLARLNPADINLLIAAMGASKHVAGRASVREKASELFEWADSSTGPGLDALDETARQVLPDFG